MTMASENPALAEDIQVSGLADSDVNLTVGEVKDNNMDNGGVAGVVGHEDKEKHDFGSSQSPEDSNPIVPNDKQEKVELVINTENKGVDSKANNSVTEKPESGVEPAPGTDSQSATMESIWTTNRDGSVKIR